MATMVKEKPKEKKKSKSKSSSRSSATRDLPSIPVEITGPLSEEICNESITSAAQSPSFVVSSPETLNPSEESFSTCIGEESFSTPSKEDTKTSTKEESDSNESKDISLKTCVEEGDDSISKKVDNKDKELVVETNLVKQVAAEDAAQSTEKSQATEATSSQPIVNIKQTLDIEYTYKDLSRKLERITIPDIVTDISQVNEFEFLSPTPSAIISNLEESPVIIEDVMPSAPCFEVEEVAEDISYGEVIVESKLKVPCMPIEDVMRLYSGGEMEQVRAMSEREEEIVEAGPVSGPEHPLVDLLSTFRSSLMAVERERVLLTKRIEDEERSRNQLWKIETRHLYLVEKCSCGQNVELSATYDHAELLRDKLPAAKMRLEGILRDVQDSYCHHQHEALLAYYQIEELISETVKSNKPVIREALSLVLMSLRQSSGAPSVLASALERWAAALSAALLDHRDLRQLLYILHHLFKQSRSVHWASRVIQVRVDIESPARVLALLELLLARPRLDTAQECTEDAEDVWEEVDRHGDGGAVSDGSLRERDLLALLHALPVRDLVARVLLFSHNDISQARPHEWRDHGGGRGVLRACIGVRALVHVLRRASLVHAAYARLQRALRDVAARTLRGLACLHVLSCENYTLELEEKLTSELEAAFFEGFELFQSNELHRLPASLLGVETARNYCLAYIEQLHDPPALSCRARVRIVAQAAIDRSYDHDLARMVLSFLLQVNSELSVFMQKGTTQ